MVKAEIGKNTRAFITQDKTLKVILPNISYDPKEGEAEIKGMVKIDIGISMDQVISANVRLWLDSDTPPMETNRKPRFFVYHPISGEVKEIEEIRFKDGSIWEAP